MNKVKGTIIGVLLGIIASTIWIYRDTLVHPDCISIWKCSSSALFKFGIIKFIIIITIIAGLVGLVIGFIMDKRDKNSKSKIPNSKQAQNTNVKNTKPF